MKLQTLLMVVLFPVVAMQVCYCCGLILGLLICYAENDFTANLIDLEVNEHAS